MADKRIKVKSGKMQSKLGFGVGILICSGILFSVILIYIVCVIHIILK